MTKRADEQQMNAWFYRRRVGLNTMVWPANRIGWLFILVAGGAIGGVAIVTQKPLAVAVVSVLAGIVVMAKSTEAPTDW